MYLKYYLDKKGARVYTFADEGPNGEVPRRPVAGNKFYNSDGLLSGRCIVGRRRFPQVRSSAARRVMSC